MKIIQNLLRVLITLLVLAAAFYLGDRLWKHYMHAPWTRDGRVQANIINVSADVAGHVVEVLVKDNQLVHKGDVLIKIDDQRYRIALAQAEAVLQSRRTDMAQKKRSAERRSKVDDLVVSGEVRELADTQSQVAAALVQEAQQQVAIAKLNLERTEVRAPVDGYITNLLVHQGDYAQTGHPQLALVDKDSFYIFGYFEETKIPLLRNNDPVSITLMSGGQALQGHIESISRAIADRDNPTSAGMLANVNPTFSWVRLAQRIPVRIHIDNVPDNVLLSAGMTCTIIDNKK
ncbi:efflux RND transporter periplasmic adaptor subunit [Sapientia aquatica]|uniref:HlyD family secretion protein n=1 Tax=Sapientia aquatica TaxID=1549640 RepID=A0A4R5VWU7_9BURK|nr:HlyD family secretion protein [Sapientia aquatica]TDK63752.1 HlyD family secretion protein [Sapientia aquatica]